MHRGLNLVERGIISAETFVKAIRYQADHRPQIGELAIRKGKLTMRQCFEILKRQADNNQFFGEIARDMRYLTKRQLADLLLLQAELTPSISESLVAVGVEVSVVYADSKRHTKTATAGNRTPSRRPVTAHS